MDNQVLAALLGALVGGLASVELRYRLAFALAQQDAIAVHGDARSFT